MQGEVVSFVFLLFTFPFRFRLASHLKFWSFFPPTK